MIGYSPAVAEIVVKLILRLPPDLHAVIVQWAKEDNRSLNRHIIHLLQQAVRQRDSK